jgi:RHS repeat-associated protein
MPSDIDIKEMDRLQTAWHNAKRMAEQALQEPVDNTAIVKQTRLVVPTNSSMLGFNNRPQGIAGTLSQTMNNISPSTNATTANNNLILAELAANHSSTVTSNNNKPSPIEKNNSAKANADIKPADATNSISYGYDNVGNLSTINLPNGITSTYLYDSRNRLTNVIVTKGNTTLARYDYVFGPANNRLSVSELGGRTVNFSYDSLYRLTSERIAGSTNPNNNGTINYTYDQVGNRLQRDSLVAAVQEQNSSYDKNDRLTTDSYDAAGRTTLSGNRTYSYDIDGHLTDVAESTSGLSIHIVYDIDGNRISKTVGQKDINGNFLNQTTTYYLVDDNNYTGNAQVFVESQSINGSTPTVVRKYVYGLGPSPISQTQLINGQWVTSYFITDGHGSVRFLTDENGNVTDSYDYDAYGNLINQIGITPNNYLYAGEQFDPDLGFYYNRARYLSVQTGRFITMDSYEGNILEPISFHKYLYASANPINNTDPSGFDTLAAYDSAITGDLINATGATYQLLGAYGQLLEQKGKTPWSPADEQGLRDYIQGHFYEYDGQNIDCADLAIEFLANYAKTKLLRVTLKGYQKTFDTNNYGLFSLGYDKFKKEAQDAIDAYSIYNFNTDQKGDLHDPKTVDIAKYGDLMMTARNPGGTYGHTRIFLHPVEINGTPAIQYIQGNLLNGSSRPGPVSIKYSTASALANSRTGPTPSLRWWSPFVFGR